MSKHIHIVQLENHYPPDQKVLRGVDLSIQRGEMVAIMGRSGSGKTTLLNILGGLDGDYQGSVEVDGQKLNGLNDSQLSLYRNQNVGFVFQSFYLLEHLSCVENIMLPGRFNRCAVDKKTAQNRADELLSLVGIESFAQQTPNRLSGGQKQRVAIARALFNQPKILICDEPTGSLDQRSANEIMALFTTLNTEHEMTLILVTHDATVAAAAQRIIVLDNGFVQEKLA